MRALRVKNRLKDLTTTELVAIAERGDLTEFALRIAWREAYVRVHYGRRFRRVKDKDWNALHLTLARFEAALAELQEERTPA